MKKLRILSLLLALCLCAGLCACGGSDEAAAPTPEATPQAGSQAGDQAGSQAGTADSELPVNIMVLNGTTGFGMAKLINDANAGAAALNYNFSVETDASGITAALINETVDIAALPTNAASVVYNKTQGKVQLLALNTRGVLYLVANSEKENITSISDLDGKTVYAPAQNPSFIFSYICQKSGINVTLDTSYAQPADLRTALAAGEVDIAVLPEPMVTIACSANDKLSVALDLTQVWDGVAPEGSLVQGCVVVRKAFAEEHPAEVAKFLEEYEASIAYLSQDAEAAGAAIESSGVFANGKVAQKALGRCNVCFIAGADMQAAMAEFLDIMFSVAPASIGGALPGEDFYYIP